jgi:hypothetical protein
MPAYSSMTAGGHQHAPPNVLLTDYLRNTIQLDYYRINTAAATFTTTPPTTTTAASTTTVARLLPLPDDGPASHKRDVPVPSSSSDRLTTLLDAAKLRVLRI